MSTARKKSEDTGFVGKLMRAVRKAERSKGDGSQVGGTGQTIIKMRQKPVEKLINDQKIGPEEVQAASDISLAFHSLASRLMIRGMSLDRVDGGRSGDVPLAGIAARAVANYTVWAKHWTQRANAYGDPMLQIVIAAIIDETPMRSIGIDLGFGHLRIERALIGGLRDYAARSGMVTNRVANKWTAEAESVFVPAHPGLVDAVRRAKIEV